MTDFFWSETGLVLRQTVSDHISGLYKKDEEHQITIYAKYGHIDIFYS